MKRFAAWFGGVLVLVGVAAGARAALEQLQAREDAVPTTMVRRGRVDTSVQATGELKATSSELLSAPAAGGQLRILSLKATGAAVAPGDTVVEFDTSDQEFQLEEQRSVLREAELEADKLDAERAVQAAQDEVDLLTARFDLRKAELDVRGNELIAAIEARKRELNLEEARRRLAQLHEDVGSRAKSSEAALAVAREKANKARLAIAQAQALLDQMRLVATVEGVVAVRENREGNFFFWGMTFSEYRQGDTVSSGRPVAEVLSLGRVELSAKIPESDLPLVAVGQRADVSLDGVSGGILPARVSHVGGIGTGAFFERRAGPKRQVDATFTLDTVPQALRPGQSARITIIGEPLQNVLYVPRQAVFDRNGKPVVFARQGDRFEPRPITVVARTTSVVVVEEVPEGTEIALADPTRRAREGGAPAGPIRVASR